MPFRRRRAPLNGELDFNL
uniref:Uncharacterized protein n=1 Tax=Rhizophora mucronata TaxID=61149 RepID=A0A2P2M2F2_RHIMU